MDWRPISADSHITEPPGCYVDNIDPAWREKAPHVVNKDGMGDIYVVDGMKTPVPMGLIAAAGVAPKDIRIGGAKFEDLHRGGWDPATRLADQDKDGVAAEIIYPTVGMLICNHPDLDYGPSNQSAPHIFVASGLVTLPMDVNLSAIGFWRSGAAFNPRGIIDSDGDGLVDQRDLTQPRNAFRVKAYADLDVRAEKKVIVGRHTMAVLVEMFNVFNRDNVANVNAVSGPQFGQPVGYLPGREMQIGVRYLFGR